MERTSESNRIENSRSVSLLFESTRSDKAISILWHKWGTKKSRAFSGRTATRPFSMLARIFAATVGSRILVGTYRFSLLKAKSNMGGEQRARTLWKQSVTEQSIAISSSFIESSVASARVCSRELFSTRVIHLSVNRTTKSSKMEVRDNSSDSFSEGTESRDLKRN